MNKREEIEKSYLAVWYIYNDDDAHRGAHWNLVMVVGFKYSSFWIYIIQIWYLNL